MDHVRFQRQILVQHIGTTGQEKIAQTCVELGPNADPLANEVAKVYLDRAGFLSVTNTSNPLEHSGVHPSKNTTENRVLINGAPLLTQSRAAIAPWIRSPECASIFEGSWLALETICTTVQPTKT